MSARRLDPGREGSPERTPEERLREIWEEHSGAVLAYALRRLGSQDAAEDIVSETFLIVWRKVDEIPSEPLPWLLGIARRVLSHHYRSRRSQMALEARLEQTARCLTDLTAPMEDLGELRQLLMTLRSLSEGDQEALALVDWEGLGNREAAFVLGITPVTFAVRLHRARRRFAVAIATAKEQSTTVTLAPPRGTGREER